MFPGDYFPTDYFPGDYFAHDADDDAVVIVVGGRTPTAVNQPPSGGTDYPFVAPSADVRLLLSDFYLSYPDDRCAYALPLKLAYLYGFGSDPGAAPDGAPTPAHAYDVVVADADGATVFDSTAAASYQTYDWGETRRIVEWRTATSVCRLVTYLGWSPNQTPQTYPRHLAPADGRLDPRTCDRLPRRVTALRVNGVDLAGTVELVAGYNVATAVADRPVADGGVFATRLTIAAQPGLGAGRAPACEEAVTPVRYVNGVGPDAAGNLILDAGECLRVGLLARTRLDAAGTRIAEYHHPGASAAAARGGLAVSNDCGPCCPCDYFVRTYRGVARLHDRWLAVAQAAEAVRDTFAANRDRWLADRDCRLAQPLKAVVLPEKDGHLMLGALWCNAGRGCVAGAQLRFAVRLYDGPAAVAGGGCPVGKGYIETSRTNGEQPYAVGGAWPVFTAVADLVDPQDSFKVRFRVRVLDPAAGMSAEVIVSLHAPDPGPGPDGSTATLPTPTPPPDAVALWAEAGLANDPPMRAVVRKTVPVDPAPNAYDCGDC